MASGPITSWEIDGETVETVSDYFGGLQSHWRWWLQPWNWKTLISGWKVMTNLDRILKSRHITLPTKLHLVKTMDFPVVLYGYEIWTLKKAECQRIDDLNCSVGDDSWEFLGLQGDPTVYAKGDQSWVFFGRTDAKTETPILWPPHVKSLLIGKFSDAGKGWGRGEGDNRG